MAGPTAAPDENSVIKVLISTDNHLGYLEKDPIRGDDSFRAFEEVLELAKANQVDMLLFAGDLFHDNKPSRSTMIRTIRLLRHACLSPGGAIRLAVRSDSSSINYMNPTVAVSLPVFVIHGNHDDPTGAPTLSAIDILAESGLVTYFGKMSNAKRIDIAPILLQKGRTALALYGLGNVRDEILHQTWARERNVKWLSPMENPSDRDRERHLPDTDTGGDDDLRWFNLFVIHQNRVTRGASKGISESLLPRWLDYVVWGHEHDSIPEVSQTSPPVVQPGSTVATSLSEGESKPKHAVLLEIYRGKFKHTPIPLYTVRKLKFHDVSVADYKDTVSDTEPASMIAFLKETVEQLREEQEADFNHQVTEFRNNTFQPRSGVRYPPNKFYIDKLTKSVGHPLVRLRVELTGNREVPNPQRFGQNFINRIASPSEILLYRRKNSKVSDKFSVKENEFLPEEDGAWKEDVQIPILTHYYLCHRKAGGSGLKFLQLDELDRAVSDFVDKEVPKAIPDYVSSYLKEQLEKSLKEAENDKNLLDGTKLSETFQKRAFVGMSRAVQGTSGDKKATADDHSSIANKAKENALELDESIDEGAASKSKGIALVPGTTDNRVDAERDAIDNALNDLHDALGGNSKLTGALQHTKGSGDSDSGDEKDDASAAPEPVEGSRSRGGKQASRARGRARGRSTSSRVATRESKTTGRQSARQATTSSAVPTGRRTRSSQKQESVISPSSVEENENEANEQDSDEVEYVPESSSRKRRARAPASSSRTPQRARTESAAVSSGSARRSSFTSRARVRRNTATIDVPDESGDDAM